MLAYVNTFLYLCIIKDELFDMMAQGYFEQARRERNNQIKLLTRPGDGGSRTPTYMINGKLIDAVHYLTMLRSLQRMQELDELNQWFVCDEGQLMTDFVAFSGVLPAPCNCIVTYKPIKSWQTNREFQWFCRIKDEEKERYVYFTKITEQ